MTTGQIESARLENSTAFERDAINLVIPRSDGAVSKASLNIRGHSPGFIADEGTVVRQFSIGFQETLGGASEELQFLIGPLLFGAGYKVLDLTLEAALHNSGDATPGQEVRMKTKADAARRSAGKLEPITSTSPEGWERICALYVAFLEVRHSLTHRRAQVNKQTVIPGASRHRLIIERLVLTPKIAQEPSPWTGAPSPSQSKGPTTQWPL